MEEFKSGAKIDTRTEKEKETDFRFEEIVASASPITWIEKKQEQWRKFQIYNQDFSGSCVAQTMRKLIAIIHWLATGKWVDPSASHIYQRRANKPQGGMAGIDVFEIARKGTTLNEYALSDNLNDAQMDAIEVTPEEFEKGKPYAIDKYIIAPIKDIDTIASIIQTTKKGVMVWFYFKHDEWLDKPVVKHPDLALYAETTSRHSVAAVDFTLVEGIKCLIIDESWDKTATALSGQRIITEDFFKARNFFAAYPMNFKYEKPFVFTLTLRFGSRGEEVKGLQNRLKKEGLFPINISSTYFGAITKKAVIAFQLKRGLVGDGVVGSLTRKALNL